MTFRKRFDTFLWMSLALLFASCQPSTDNTAGNESATTDSREIKVITSGSFAAAYNILAPEFERATGIKLVTAYGSSSGGAVDSIPSRLARGESADIIILSRSSLDNLTAEGEVVAESRVDLVRSSIGMAVRSVAFRLGRWLRRLWPSSPPQRALNAYGPRKEHGVALANHQVVFTAPEVIP